ncbi:hypothetical protein NL676_007323 [Syzygium grande]|nr:hypothetical protein NL676_007323 [Syzygium grande]
MWRLRVWKKRPARAGDLPVFVDPHNTTKFLVPAIRNNHTAFVKYNLHNAIKISSPIALSSLQEREAAAYPSSAGSSSSGCHGQASSSSGAAMAVTSFEAKSDLKACSRHGRQLRRSSRRSRRQWAATVRALAE